MPWTTERLLIWGKTYPELSRSKLETVCTGGVLLDRPGLVRVYPLDYRYLEPEHRPKKWSIVSAQLDQAYGDGRSESRKVNAASLRVLDHIGTENNWEERRRLMLRPEHMVSGLEELQELRKSKRQTLGIVKPTKVHDVTLEKTTRAQKDEFWEKYRKIEQQRDFWQPGTKMVPIPRYRTRLTFETDGDPEPLRLLVLDWEVVEVSKKHEVYSDAEARTRKHLFDRAFSEKHDPYLILGNINGHPHVFVVVAVFYPMKAPPPTPPPPQGELF